SYRWDGLKYSHKLHNMARALADMTGQLEAVRTHSLVSDTEISVTVEATVPLPLDVGLGDVTVTATRAKEQ
ncbi:MAG: hypothetical protein ACFN1H_10275, partial [Propionibacterium freudenreichii]